MDCIWSRYINKVADIDSMFEFVRDNGISSWKVNIGGVELADEYSIRTHVDDCIQRQYIPWAALFVNP